MLMSVQVKKIIENEIKGQNSLIKMLEKQEILYNADVKKVVDHAGKTIEFYEKFLKEGQKEAA